MNILLNSPKPIWRPHWLFLVVLAWLVYTPAHAANTGETTPVSQVGTAEPGGNQDADEEEQDSLLDRQKRFVDTQVQRASTWVDAFFQDPNFEAEGAYSEIRIRPELYYREEQGLEGRFRFRARFNLPNLGRKVSLFIGSDDDDSDIQNSADDSTNQSAIGLQFFVKESSHWNTSFAAGIKTSEFAGFTGPRVRYSNLLGEKGSYRITQTLLWQTNNYWQVNTRLDLNRVINDFFFFRETFDGRWRGEKAEEEGYRTEVSSVLTQRLSPKSGLQYEFSTVFFTHPDTHVDKYVVSVRYRKRTKRDWLYYEIVPQVSFENEYDYKFNPGIRLRLEIFYGSTGAKNFWRQESEDTENFRW